MTVEFATCETFRKAFITALLLTGDAEEAEGAVLQGIDLANLEDWSEDALVLETAKASIRMRGEILKPRTGESMLPPELRRVFGLSRGRRHCFVLRVLVNLSREDCGRLLQMEENRIDEQTSAAMLELAMMQEKGAAATAASN